MCVRMAVGREQSVNHLQIRPVLSETAQLKLITIGFALNQRRNGSAVNEDVLLDVAPYLCQAECDNHRAAVFYPLSDCLHERPTLKSFFETDKLQRRIRVWVIPSCFG